MKKTILEIYALAVCFFTVACFVITLGMAIWDTIELSAPEFTISNHNFECHYSDEAYNDCYSSKHQFTRDDSPKTFPSGQELTEKRQKAYEQILKSEQRQALQGLVQKLIILLIDALVFFAHWRLASSSRENHS